MLLAGTANLASQQTFRATVGGVVIDVSVMSAGKPIEGLTARDFELRDNGVLQQVDVVSAGHALLDFTILLDYAGRAAARMARLADGLVKVVRELRPTDRLQLLACGQSVREIVPMQLVSDRIHFDELKTLSSDPHYTSTMNDCFAEALVLRSPPDRRHAIIAFSALSAGHNVLQWHDLLMPLARTTDATLFVGAIPVAGAYPPGWFQPIGEAAAMTGGQLWLGVFPEQREPMYVTRGRGLAPIEGLVPFDDVVKALEQIVDNFRRGYVISYTPHNIPAGGWHDVSVKVLRPSSKPYVVRARKGYFGESARQSP
ncbi:MAG TPA: hypothetical protein VJN96_07855 [Vicinamibacterales bacterium]|nr:hypothetical protein [Vicinamibacterales bacterium]